MLTTEYHCELGRYFLRVNQDMAVYLLVVRVTCSTDLFDQLVCNGEECRRHGEAERLGSCQVDDRKTASESRHRGAADACSATIRVVTIR